MFRLERNVSHSSWQCQVRKSLGEMVTALSSSTDDDDDEAARLFLPLQP